MAPDAPASRRSARGQAKRSYAESDGEDEPERVEVPKSKAKPSAKGRKPASKKAKKLSEDIIEDGRSTSYAAQGQTDVYTKRS